MGFRLSFGPIWLCQGVSEYYKSEQNEITGQLRIVLGVLGLGLVFLLAVAAVLKPSPFLIGTHQQLGLPPCSFLVIFGIPCPTCGMTTAWACLMHGEFSTAFQANSGGVLLAILDTIAGPWLVISAIRGRWLCWKPNGAAVACVSTVILTITLVQWAFRLFVK
jgi:hypothetical protein